MSEVLEAGKQQMHARPEKETSREALLTSAKPRIEDATFFQPHLCLLQPTAQAEKGGTAPPVVFHAFRLHFTPRKAAGKSRGDTTAAHRQPSSPLTHLPAMPCSMLAYRPRRHLAIQAGRQSPLGLLMMLKAQGVITDIEKTYRHS